MRSFVLPRSRTARALLLATVVLGLPLLAAAAVVGRYSSPASTTARYEQRLLADLIDRDLLAVALAERCLERAPHAELASACREIASARAEQVARMQGWLAEWYGIDHAPRMKQVAARREAVLDDLSDEEFEATFLDMMTVDQEQAVDEATACLERVQQPELRTLCGDVTEQQTAGVEQMREWLCRWHRVQCDMEW